MDAYERERQNNALLDDLAAKVSALRGVTVDIYDSARDHASLDAGVRGPRPPPPARPPANARARQNEVFANLHSSLKNSAGRVRLMAQTGGRVAVLRLAAMLVVAFTVLYLLWGWVARG